MKYIKEYLKDVIRIKPLGELTTKDDILVGMSGEMVYIDGKCADIFISHADYANWLESKYEQKPYGQRKECLDCQFNYAGECKGSCQIKRSEQNSVDKVELKFKVGDWIVNNISKDVFLIKSTNNGYYTLEDIKGNIISPCLPPCEDASHLWTIEDAKDGDVLATDSWLYIFKYTNNKDIIQFHCTCPINGRPYKWCFLPDNSYLDIFYVGANIHPATKEQRDTLFAKMKKSGYKWDAKKKELKLLITNGGDITGEPDNKIESFDEFAGLTDFERTLADICIGWIGEEPGWKQYIKDNADVLLKIAIEKFNSVQDTSFEQKSAGWCEEDEGFLKLLLAIFTNEHPNGLFSTGNIGNCVTSNEIITWLKSIKDKIQLKSAKWNEEDDKRLKSCLNILQPKTLLGNTETINTKWLKSLKQRMRWKPSKEQMHYLNWLANVKLGDSVVEQEVSKHLNGLYEDLKKL